MLDIRGIVGKRDKRSLANITRKDLVTWQDCYNIKRKICFQTTRRHDNDAMSVHKLIAELREETYDPVLVYKPQGQSFENTSIPDTSFLAAIQTKFQLELYRKYAPVILCVDSTHCTTAYGFKLITLLVADDHHEG